MIDAIHVPGSARDGDRLPALHGMLIAESDTDITVRVADGTWTFRRDDVLRMLESDSTDPAPGRPVLIDLRPGTTAEFTRTLRIDVVDRPMTLACPPSPALGDELLRELTESWADELHLLDAHDAATFTYCQTKSHAGSDDGINCDSLD